MRYAARIAEAKLFAASVAIIYAIVRATADWLMRGH
jgi:hypothetical protein